MSPDPNRGRPGVRLAVLCGGVSGEREVSLASGAGVMRALTQPAAPGDSLAITSVERVELALDGAWEHAQWRAPAPEALLRLSHVDVFFVCLHGGDGENGVLQGLLRASGRAHTGSGVQASALCMDKYALRGLAVASGVRVASGTLVSERGWRRDRERELARLLALGGGSWFVKPRSGGSSVNTTLARDPQALTRAVDTVLDGGDDALVESRVEGVELSCGVLEFAGEARALTPIEIQPAAGAFFDYEQKYATSGARELCPPVSLPEASLARVRALAELMHGLARCEDYSRTDFIVPRGADGFAEPVLLEINTLPGLTPRSLLPQEAAVDGLEYRQLCLLLVESALRRARQAGAR